MEEKKKGSAGKVIIVILLLIIFLVGGVFAGYYISTNNLLNNIFKTSEKKDSKLGKLIKAKELDLDSRIVKFLYDEVSEDINDPICTAGWRYGAANSEDNTRFNDFTYDKTNEITMNLVGKNLKPEDEQYAPIEEAPIVEGKRNYLVYYGQGGSQNATSTFKYEKKDVEKIYKQIFGSDSTLDTSIPIKMDVYGGQVLHFDSSKNAYYPQYIDTGGTCGPGGYTFKLVKAEKDGNKIVLTQEAKNITYKEDANGELNVSEANEVKTDLGKLIYTFELEDDGMYKFVSRVYKAK